MSNQKKLGKATRLVHMGRDHPDRPAFVNPPVARGSTVLFPTVAMRNATREQPFDQVLSYGLKGGPTHFHLEDAIAEIEGGTRCQIVSTGLAAVTTALFVYLKNGQHGLFPDTVYGPTRNFLTSMGTGCGMEFTFYPPDIDEAGLRALVRDNTTMIYCESPGSHTMEMQDVPMLSRIAKDVGVKLVMDNTWGFSLFAPFEHGVDCSIQAATKYIGGHSDVMLGAITTNSDSDYERVRTVSTTLGHFASPDDCWLALRGLRTLNVRLRAHMQAGLRVAGWLREQPEVAQVLHPGLPDAAGHDIWKRDFTGACGLFSVELTPDYAYDDMVTMIDGLQLFGIGASWGGYESLVLPVTGAITRTAEQKSARRLMFRLHIGLEDTEDLIADLKNGLNLLKQHAAKR